MQQLSTIGLDRLVHMTDAESIYGICINHWCTAENAIAISYAAEVFIAPLSVTEYYVRYANKIGIADTQGFVDACSRLSKMDLRRVWGPGFCFVGCWYAPNLKNNIMRPWKQYSKKYEVVPYTIGEYASLSNAFNALLKSAQSTTAIQRLRLLANRCLASSIYMENFAILAEIYNYYDYDHPAPLTKLQTKQIRDIFDRVYAYAMEYIRLYGELLPDRGNEGMIASHCETGMRFFEKVEEGILGQIQAKDFESFDVPPAPDPQK